MSLRWLLRAWEAGRIETRGEMFDPAIELIRWEKSQDSSSRLRGAFNSQQLKAAKTSLTKGKADQTATKKLGTKETQTLVQNGPSGGDQ